MFGLSSFVNDQEILLTTQPISLAGTLVVAGNGISTYQCKRPKPNSTYFVSIRFGGIADDDRDDYIQHGNGLQFVKMPTITDLGGGLFRVDTTELGNAGGISVDLVGNNMWALYIYAKYN